MGRLDGRVALVTGAAQGIGTTYALALAAEGARVSVCDLQEPAATLAAIRAQGGEAIGMAADVTSAAAVAAWIDATVRAFGTVHVLVNNAAMFGTLGLRPFTEIASDEWDRVMTVNTRGTFECVKAVVPAMRAQRYGRIINVASGTVFKGTPNLMHYVASKGAVIAMTRVMARELGADNIGVNCIAPGLTMSQAVIDMYPDAAVASTTASRCFQRDETPDDLTGTLIYLASGDSDFVTGQTILVDGGSALH